MDIIGIHHIAIICSDFKKSKCFYTQIIPGTVIRETYRAERDSYKLDLALPDGSQIELFSFPNPPARPSRPEAQGLRHIAFNVSDIDQAVADLIKKGIEVEPVRQDELTGKRFTFFPDPDQLPIELYEK